MNDVIVPSFGPQIFPLSQTAHFGISQAAAFNAKIEVDEKHLSAAGWTCVHAAKEVWLHVNASAQADGIDLEVRWVGMAPATRLSFSFYVRAQTCLLESGQRLTPASLCRFEGQSQKLIFNDRVSLTASELHNLQVIPLAGSNCFWNSTFLLSFECNSYQNCSCYSFRFQ
jgi:hypothetical protein